MGLIDLNSCTARQLTEYAHIRKSLADSIIRYRRCFGGFKHIDELWKITGISRASYRNLQQFFHVEGQTVPAIGERLPNAKVAVTESMLQVLTQEHLTEQRTVNKTSGKAVPKKTADSGTSGYARSVKSAKQGKTEEWQLPTSEVVERAKSSQNATKDPKSADVQSPRVNQCEAIVGDTTLEIDGQIINALSSVKDDKTVGKVVSPRGKYFRKAWDGLKSPKEKGVVSEIQTAEMNGDEEPVGPSVVLRATSSGNNINVSCTFDKNLLISEKPVALKFNANKKKEKVEDVTEEAIDGRKDREGKNQNQGAKKFAATGKSKPKEPTTKSGGNKSDTDEAKGKNAKKREHHAPISEKESPHVVAELNTDNLDYFTAENRYGAAKQRKVIEAWIEDVNEHISNRTLACTGQKVLSVVDKGQEKNPYAAAGPSRKTQTTNERTSFQIKTKNIKFGEDRPSTSGQSKMLESSNANICPGITFPVNGIWSKLRDMASAPFRGLYDSRLPDDLQPPTVPNLQNKRASPSYVRPTYREEMMLPVKRRHNEKRMPPLPQESHHHQRAAYPSSSSSGRLPRKSAKPSRPTKYVSENRSHNSGGTLTRSRNSQPISPSCRRWVDDTRSRSFKYSSPSPMLSEKNASKSWRDMQIQLLQKRLKQTKNSSSHPSPRRKASQKYALSPEAPNRGHKFV